MTGNDAMATSISTANPRRGTHGLTDTWTTQRAQRCEALVGFTGGPLLRQQPGLDGLRGLAVLPVVLFHTGSYSMLVAGQMVMSWFFTLSGFLIASIVLNDLAVNRSFSARRFWADRSRRILPPFWMMLAAVGLTRLVTDEFEIADRADNITALTYVSNWYLTASGAFADVLFQDRSPAFHHSWSLSIEEQFYIAIALAMMVIAARSTQPVVALRRLALTVMVVSLAIPRTIEMTGDRQHFGTDTRAAELAAGVVLATILVDRGWRLRLASASRSIALLGALALGGMLAIGVGFALDYHPTADYYPLFHNRLMMLVIALSLVVIVGAMVPDGPLSWLTNRRPLRWIGRRSYGIYLYHLPLVLIVRDHVTNWPARLLLIVGASVILADLSYRYVEMPIRRRQWPTRTVLMAGAATLAVILATTALI